MASTFLKVFMSNQKTPSTYIFRQYRVCQSNAFSLVELTVMVLLIALLLIASASLFTSSTQATRKGTKYNKVASLIDADITEMKRLGENFSCCAITALGAGCSAEPNPPCSNSLPSSSYYFPEVNSYDPLSANDQQKINAFSQLCQNGLVTPLITAMRQNISGGLFATVESTPVYKTVVKDKADSADHSLRITYTATGINRVSIVVPSISAWCP